MGMFVRIRNSRLVLSALATGLLSTTPAIGSDSVVDHSIIPKAIADTAVLLRERALLDNLSVDIVESLTTHLSQISIGTDIVNLTRYPIANLESAAGVAGARRSLRVCDRSSCRD